MKNLEELIEKLKKEELFKDWEFSSVPDKKDSASLQPKEGTKETILDLYKISRESKGVVEARIYIDQELKEGGERFGVVCLVINSLKEPIEKDTEKRYFSEPELEKLEVYIREKVEHFNKTYFNKNFEQPNPRLRAL